MKTKDLEKIGIDRNFLRQCEKQGIVKPNRKESDWIIHEEYKAREYSQKDIETVWDAQLYRKMGLSYSQIKSIMDGENIPLRDDLNSTIQRYEEEIKELEALIRFAKYVKGIGFLPIMPKEEIGGDSFSSYINNCMEYFDKDKRLLTYVEMLGEMAEIDFDKATDEELNEIEERANAVFREFGCQGSSDIGMKVISLNDMVESGPDSEPVQEIIRQYYGYNREQGGNDFTTFDFGMMMLEVLEQDCDFSKFFHMLLKPEAYKLFEDGIMHFLVFNNPTRFKQIS